MIPAACSPAIGLRAASRFLLASVAFGLLAACGGSGPDRAAGVASKYVAHSYTATPVVAPAGVWIDPAYVRLSEQGHLAGMSYIPPNRNNIEYYWTIARGYTEITPAGGYVADVNDAGFVVGTQSAGPGYTRPFSWSPDSGLRVDLPYVGRSASAIGVSNGATVIGEESMADGSPNRPVYWRFDGTRHEVALPGPERTAFVDINRRGEATGNYGNQPFIWTEASGMTVLPLPAGVSRAAARSIGEGGHVAGYADMADGSTRPFLWRSDTGFRIVEVDIGNQDFPHAFWASADGALITSAQHNGRPIYWSADGGLRDLIGEAGVSGQALSISADGTVVGWYKGADEIQRAFAWTPVTGLIDLNSLLPQGLNLHLEMGRLNTSGGHILAVANGRLIMLAPADGTTPPASTPPIVTDISGVMDVNVGSGFTVTAHFTDVDAGEQHRASWDWGDGSDVNAGTITAGEGGHTVTGSHSYAAPGVYEITLTVTDAAGNQVNATRKITVVENVAGQVLGIGDFVSVPGAVKSQPDVAGRAEIAFVARHGENGEAPYGALAFRFRAAGLVFEATEFSALTVTGNRALIMGNGAANGDPGYFFSVLVIDEAAQATRPRIRFLITAPDGHVYYDNQPGPGVEAGDPVGAALTDGTVKIGDED